MRVQRKISTNTAIAMLACGQTIVWSCLYYVFPALLLRWESALGWSKLALTGAISVALFVSAVSSPLFGKFIDKGFGPLMMALGALVGGVVICLLPFVSHIWQFYVIWIVIGLCFTACLYEPCFALLTRAYGARAKRAIITVTLVAGFASALSFPAAHFIANSWGWPAVVRCFGLAAIVLGVPLLYFGAHAVERRAVERSALERSAAEESAISNPTGADSNATAQDRFVYLRNPVVRSLGISFAFLALVHGATLHHLLHILADRGLTVGSSVMVASMIGPMQVFGRLIVTAFQNRLRHKWIAYGCFVLMGLAMATLFLANYGFWIAICFAVVFGSGYGVVSIIRPVIARDLLGDQHFGEKSGLLAFFFLLGSAVAPWFGSLVWAAGGYNALIVALGLLAFCGLWLILRSMSGN